MLMPEHVCYCKECKPEVFYDGPKLGDNHIAIRFAQKPDDYNYRVYCDGAEITKCFECLAGSDGWAASYVDDGSGTAHVCACRRGVCAKVQYGDVRLEPREAV